MAYSACIEMLFAPEAEDIADRIGLAKQAGFDFVEFWRWQNKDIAAIAAALAEHEVKLSGLVAEPMVPLTDPGQHDAFLAGLEQSVAVAQRLGAPVLIAQAGNDLSQFDRRSQHAAIVACLKRAAGILDGSGVTLTLEPLNTLVDHKGYFLHSTAEGLDIVDEVGSASIRLLYDIYHSQVMGEDWHSVLDGRVDRIGHVHLADAPGRNEPGSGDIDWRPIVSFLRAGGYAGPIGLEYRPTGASVASLSQLDM